MQYSANPVYLSEDSRVILANVGDLTGDGKNDLAVVVEFDSDQRHIYILLENTDGSYTVANKSESLILERTMGGPFGDPLESVSIEDGILNIKHFGGSSGRWSYNMQFAYENGHLILVKMGVLGYSTHTINGAETIFDFTGRRVERYSWSGGNESWDGLLLFSDELPDEIYLFDNLTFDEAEAFNHLPFLPYFEHYEFDRFDRPLELKISAAQALDMIMSEQ
jgi:hypothetical protein